jgi:hypothetical protein
MKNTKLVGKDLILTGALTALMTLNLSRIPVQDCLILMQAVMDR